MPPPPPKVPAVLVFGLNKLVPVVAVVLVEPKVPVPPPNPEVPPPKVPKPVAGLGAPKTEVVVAGCVVFCPKPPTVDINLLSEKGRKNKDPKHTKGGGGGIGRAQVAKHWVCRLLLLGLTKGAG